MLQIQVLRNVKKKLIVVNGFKCLVSLKASFLCLLSSIRKMEYPILLKLYNYINTDHLGSTSPCSTPHRTVNFDDLHNTVSIPDSL